MKRFAAVGGILVLSLLGLARSQPPSGQKPADPPPDAEAVSRRAIVASAGAFDAAYNAHDPDAVAGLFAEGAEFTDADGTIAGRGAIRDAFVRAFAASPTATVRTVVESVSFPAPGVAIELGRAFSASGPEEREVEERYLVVHARRGDGWEIASVREDAADAPPTPDEALWPLSWLVGDWIDESYESKVETSCRRSEDGNWLLQDYVVRLAAGPEMTGTQRIGWDGSRKQVRSWSFDSEGGYLEATWTFDGERWIAQASGVAAGGAIGSGTRVLTPLGADAYLLESFHRVLDGEPLPDNEVTVVRRPPSAESAADADPPADEAAVPAAN